MKKFINRLFGRSHFNKEPKYKKVYTDGQKSDFDKFKNWLHQQNALSRFARNIRDGTTVYFSDDFAAAYDLQIIGLGKEDHTIVVQLNVYNEGEADTLNEDFLDKSVKTWTALGWEVWYLDNALQWLIIDNGTYRIFYNKKDLIKSNSIHFQFTLDQIL